jgi:hypothetical protein
MSRTRRWLLGIALSLAGLVTYCSWDSWEDVDVALPDGAGVLTFSRRPAHPFLAEDAYRITLRRADGRTLRNELDPNLGGRTVVLLQWQPAASNGGPFLMIEDNGQRWAWVSVGRPCLRTDGEVPVSRACTGDDLPRSHDWRYFGHIDDRGGQPGMRFVPGAEIPRDLPLVRRISSDTVPIPGTDWSITLFRRPSPDGASARPYLTMRLASRHGQRLWSAFPQDLFRSGKASFSLYPADSTSGPFLQIGSPGVGERRIDCLLVDLGGGRVFQLRDVQGSKWIEELVRPGPGDAALTVRPAPAAVADRTPRPLGAIRLRELDGPGFEWLDGN